MTLLSRRALLAPLADCAFFLTALPGQAHIRAAAVLGVVDVMLLLVAAVDGLTVLLRQWWSR